MNPNLILEISELRRIYKQTKSIYKNKGYSYKNRVRQCTFTNNLLKEPVLMCRRGFLFNSEALLKALAKRNLPQRLSYIRSEADVRRVTLTQNKTKKHRFPFCCPLTAKVLNGANPFVLLWSCGCLMYEKLLFPLAGIKTPLETILQRREDGDSSPAFTRKRLKCPNCRAAFALNSLFSLNLSSKKNSRPGKTAAKKTDADTSAVLLLGKRPSPGNAPGAAEPNKARNGAKRIKTDGGDLGEPKQRPRSARKNKQN